MQYEVVIGLEVHAQLKTKTKLFCRCSTQFGDKPNTNVCEVCLGMPGALPVLNKASVELAIRAGLAVDCTIHNTSVFERKNYFYPDLPKGYQISQFELPICTKGKLEIEGGKVIGITRIHMEEDAGKLLHQGAEGIAGSTHSLVDLNRACTPLIEIVSEPDIRSAQEAKSYVEALKEILEYLDICDGNLEEGSLRVDANVSLRPVGTVEFGTRTETKNLNSFRSVQRAIEYEIQRQTICLDQGEAIIQETRNYNDQTGKTTSLRSKADAHDYRYFPDPDLKPLIVSDDDIEKVRVSLAELPASIKKRYINEFGIRDIDAQILINDRSLQQYFELCISKKPAEISQKEICKWLLGDYSALMNTQKLSFAKPPLSVANFLELLSLLQSADISGKMAKELLPKMIETGKTAAVLLDETGGRQVSDTSALDAWVVQVIEENPDVITKIKGGKPRSADFLMGQVMKLSRGQANPDLVRKLLADAIESQ